MGSVNKIFKVKENNIVFKTPQNQNSEAFEDYSIKKNIDSQEATFGELNILNDLDVGGDLDIGFSQGSIIFQGVNGLTEDTNFLWDDANDVMKITNSIEDSIGISLNNPIIATPPEAQNSPIFELSGNIWNSATGTKGMSGGMQVQHDLNNANPPISKLSFLVGSNSDSPTEQMFVTSLGQFNILGGGDFAGTSLSESNSLILRNKAAATSSVPQNSNKIVLEGRAWNSAQGNIDNQGYIQLLNSINNANPFTERMGFFMQEGVRNGDFTERLSIDNEGNVGIGTIGPTEKLEVFGNAVIEGNLHMFLDGNKIYYGTDKDASIYYDGTDLIINPKVVGSGRLDVSGDLVHDGYYGSMYQHDVPTTITITISNTWYTITGMSTGLLNGCTYASDGITLSANNGGTYKVDWSCSLYDGATTDYHVVASVNGTPDIQSDAHCKTVSSNDEITLSGTSILSLSAGDVVTMEIKNVSNTNNPTITHASINLVWAGK